ncbi:glycogen debranching protein GlgX [Actinosynnema sp. NPDC059797]
MSTVLPERIDAYPTHRIADHAVRAGRLLPFGATPVPGGINFSVYSNNATAMTLVLFRRGEREPVAELPIPECFRIGGVYAITVLGLDPETTQYGYRADGPFRPEEGHRFDPSRVLLDPYARVLEGQHTWGLPVDHEDRYFRRCGIVPDDFDWEGDRPLNRPEQDVVVYEAHVRGFTRHDSSGVDHPGTFAGLVQKIPYLVELGVNCVELMPVFEFDEMDNARVDPTTGERLHNYWGYSTVGFFAPKASYAATGRHGMQVDEFKNLVKQLHRAGIEVVLDVVFNHTAEGNELGPTMSFRGLDNRVYYMLTPDGHYYNFSGTGNTVNCNHPVVRGFVLDCLRYWASEFHVDGFRFDLASILGRAQDGRSLSDPPLVESLASDPVLRDCKLIAEAWDAGGLYQVGSFPDYCRFAEWNGRYRDTVRRFLRGDLGVTGDLATRLVGSPDLYQRRGPVASVNFVTAHDGFTLHDLVSYNEKHNDGNGEGNRDGDNANHSWNCGAEGPTDDPEILALRGKQQRNALLLLLTSLGVPMIVAGDEVGRTQRGNNNAYCHDDEVSWFDWRLVERNRDMLRFTRNAIAFRAAHPALRRRTHPIGHMGDGLFPDVSWHGAHAWTPEWSGYNRLIAVMHYTRDEGVDDCVYVAANAHWEPCDLELPELPAHLAWHLFADTSAPYPHDSREPGDEPRLTDQSSYRIAPRSVLVLAAGGCASTHRGEDR